MFFYLVYGADMAQSMHLWLSWGWLYWWLNQVKIKQISVFNWSWFLVLMTIAVRVRVKKRLNYNLETIKSLCTFKCVVRFSRVLRLMKLRLNRLVKSWIAQTNASLCSKSWTLTVATHFSACLLLSRVGGWVGGLIRNKANLSQAKLNLSWNWAGLSLAKIILSLVGCNFY